MNKSNLLLALAIRNRGYTDKTRLRGFKILDFLLVHGGGLCLCSSEFHSPNLPNSPDSPDSPDNFLALAIRNRGYTDKTRLRGFRILDFLLVHGGGLCLCSSEFHSPNSPNLPNSPNSPDNFQTLAAIGGL